MKSLLYYRVKGQWVQNWEEGVVVSFEEEFSDPNPIVSRNAALEFYQRKIECLLGLKGLKHRIHKNLTDDLWTIFSAPAVGYRLPDAPWKRNLNLGIGVYCVFDDETDENMYRTDWCIHGVGDNSAYWEAGSYLVGLCYERMVYDEKGYDTSGQAITARYWDMEDDNQITEYEILDTPYCWNPDWRF